MKKSTIFTIVLFVLSVIGVVFFEDGAWYERVILVGVELVIMLGNIFSEGIGVKFLRNRIVEFLFFYATIFLGGRAYDMLKESDTIWGDLMCHSIMLPIVWFWFHRFTAEEGEPVNTDEEETGQKERTKELTEKEIVQFFDLPAKYELRVDGDANERFLGVFQENTLLYQSTIVMEDIEDEKIFYIEDLSRMVDQEINDHVSGRILDGVVEMAKALDVQTIAINTTAGGNCVENALSQDEMKRLVERHVAGKGVELKYCNSLDDLRRARC